MENSWQLLAIISLFAVAFISKIFKIRRRPEPKLPPGPKPWPIIGNLNLVGSLPHQSLHHLSQKYGEIMLLKFGTFPVVIASSPKMAEQFLKVHDTVFATRPPLAIGKHISYNYSDVSFAPYGPYWREMRKIYMSELLSVKRLDNSEQIRVEERQSFLSRLKGLSEENAPVLLREHLSRYILSTICRMVITDKYCSESEEESSIPDMPDLHGMVHDWSLLTGVFNIGDWIPWLDFLDLQGYVKKMKDLRRKTDKFFGCVIDDRLARRHAGKDCGKKDILDVLLQIAEDPHAEVELTRDNVIALTMNLVVGAPDNTITTIEWAMHEMLRHPRMIEKAKEELNKVVGRNRWVEENDFNQLPYIDAIIFETFRFHPINTLLAPHYSTKDCNVAGYDIPKGTTVLINLWSMGRDPNTWDAPEEFSPERFVGKEIDMNGSNFTLLPFGSGRRKCPGFNLGLRIIRTTLANLLHGFELKLVEGMRAEDICMEEQYGLATSPKHPPPIVMKPTLPGHLY